MPGYFLRHRDFHLWVEHHDGSDLFRQDERGWATTDYRAGDVLVFHCLTSHAALPNLDTSLRLSGDFRWQRPDQTAPAQLVPVRAAVAEHAGHHESEPDEVDVTDDATTDEG